MDVTLIERLANAACELDAAREYLGTDETVLPLWNGLLELQNEIEAIIRAEAAS